MAENAAVSGRKAAFFSDFVEKMKTAVSRAISALSGRGGKGEGEKKEGIIEKIKERLKSAVPPRIAEMTQQIIKKIKKRFPKGRYITVFVKGGRRRIWVSSLAGYVYHPYHRAYLKREKGKKLAYKKLPMVELTGKKANIDELTDVFTVRGRGKKKIYALSDKYAGKYYIFKRAAQFRKGYNYAFKSEAPVVVFVGSEFFKQLGISSDVKAEREKVEKKLYELVPDKEKREEIKKRMREHPDLVPVYTGWLYSVVFRKKEIAGKEKLLRVKEAAIKELLSYQSLKQFEDWSYKQQSAFASLLRKAGYQVSYDVLRGVRFSTLMLREKPKASMYRVIESPSSYGFKALATGELAPRLDIDEEEGSGG